MNQHMSFSFDCLEIIIDIIEIRITKLWII